jgi:hypothetical protein
LTLANAHFVDSDKNGTASGTGAWQSAPSDTSDFYIINFDGADETNPIEAADTLAGVEYDFKTDDDCVAIWNMNSVAGSIVEDEKGGNDLAVNGTPTIDEVNFKEGTGSIDLSPNNDYLTRTDATLDAGFPLKSGDTNKKISVTYWVKFNTLTDFDAPFCKWSSATSKRSFIAGIYRQSGTYRFTIGLGYSNGSSSDWAEAFDPNTTVQTGRWYHVGMTYEDSGKTWRVRVWDDTAQTATEGTGTWDQNINVEDANVYVGRYDDGGYVDGLVDQVVVFKDILTAAEIDSIRIGGDYTFKGTCSSITYATSSTGTLTYTKTAGSVENNEIVYGGGNNVTASSNEVQTGNGFISQQDRTTAHPQDWAHLEGQTVDVLQDGVVSTDAVITSGDPVPALTGAVNHVGMNYVSTLKPSKLDIQGMGLILTKKITKAIVSFYNTLKGKYGLNTDTMYEMPFTTTAFTGIKELPFRGEYEREGDIVIQQDEPLPMTCRGIIFNAGIHEVK